jgi:hypothetical protein
MLAMGEDLRGEIKTGDAALREEIAAAHQELVALITDTTGDTRREMRVLYEDLKATITTLGR